jgi:tRNA(Ile)-lysidine synthase
VLQKPLVERVRTAIDEHGLLPRGEPVVVGVSGGPDSLCLLHALRALAPAYGATLHAAHMDHGIRPEAGAEAAYVTRLCGEWGLPCTVESADVPARAAAQGLSLEEAARQARYAFLGRLARSLGAHTVAVGHHADDQVETVLMHLLRGSGLAGLRGMRPLTPLGELYLGPDVADAALQGIYLARPLLGVTRAEIVAYCQEQGLEPLYDRSNLDTTLFRNRIRHELIPYLEGYNPNLRAALGRMAEALAGDDDLLRGLLAETWPTVVRQEAGERILLDLAALRALPVGLQRSLLREAVRRLRRSLRDIAFEHTERALEIVRQGRTGDRATLPGGLLLTLGYDAALLAAQGVGWPPEERPRVGAPTPVALPGETPLPDGRWRLTARVAPRQALPAGWQSNPDPYTGYFDAERLRGPLLLRPRRPGDALYPLGLGRSQSVKELLINAKLPRHERDAVPLLVCNDQVAWVAGVRVDARYAITGETVRVLWLRFEPIERSEAQP